MNNEEYFQPLIQFLTEVPAVDARIGHGRFDNGNWWVKFVIDIKHALAWQVVQEFGHVLNYVSLEERLPTVFMPVSPPPYMNGGPEQFLSWIIESTEPDFHRLYALNGCMVACPIPLQTLRFGS